MRGNSHVRFESGENLEITSKDYLSIYSIYPSRITILSTRKTEEKTINNTYFKNYPHIIPDYPSSISDLIMTVIPNNSYLTALGGDYDGEKLVTPLHSIKNVRKKL